MRNEKIKLDGRVISGYYITSVLDGYFFFDLQEALESKKNPVVRYFNGLPIYYKGIIIGTAHSINFKTLTADTSLRSDIDIESINDFSLDFMTDGKPYGDITVDDLAVNISQKISVRGIMLIPRREFAAHDKRKVV